jgi:hexosaminidase
MHRIHVRTRGGSLASATVGLAAALAAGCAAPAPSPFPAPDHPSIDLGHTVIPLPVSVSLSATDSFTVDANTVISVEPGNEDAARVGRYLAELIALSPQAAPPVHLTGEPAGAGSISLRLGGDATALGAEGYELAVESDRVVLVADQPAGLFYGVQTIRQLLPAAVEHTDALNRSLRMPTGQVRDHPRYEWRGAMLDVARHFLPVEDVKRYVDLMALYKLNRLHLHLSDDQGWRIEIRSWPNLAIHGGSTDVGGGPGGYYTQEEFAELVSYAADRFITIVPEIDLPGHTNAALASYPELNCDGVAPPLYTGTTVGFSVLCVDREITYTFIDDVVREISALNPGPYFHLGGDEVEKLTDEEYVAFIERAQKIVASHGKRVVGWGEIAPARLLPGTIVQHWQPADPPQELGPGVSLLLSPADRIYLDMKYDSTTVTGLTWAGIVDVRRSYDWEPADLLGHLPADRIIGVEAPLWSESVRRLHEFEYLAFPRLLGVAEIGWSPAGSRDWYEYRERLGRQGQRLQALGVNFYRSPQVPWRH